MPRRAATLEARARIVFEDDFAFRVADPASNQAAMHTPTGMFFLKAADFSADIAACRAGLKNAIARARRRCSPHTNGSSARRPSAASTGASPTSKNDSAILDGQKQILAARRGGALILPVSENDIIFCIPLQWNAKNDIVFAYRFVLINAAVHCNNYSHLVK
ncbi:MAG: hypothetical protein EBU46_09895 [Nitrosomonadaceae bacterium]|nr:hypothetical protein [Nitrosomonadaceae bacterium]